ncbi:NfeD family protein [Akkermansia muciniphila]|nr:NfeD family protein [Akkermansia muciniphila]
MERRQHAGGSPGHPLLKLALGLTGGSLLIALLMKYLPDSVLMRRVTNATVSGGSAGEAVNIARVQVGDRGNAVTELKPNGKAMIHGEICEVFSRQGILIKGTPVRVVDIRPFDLVVVKDDSPPGIDAITLPTYCHASHRWTHFPGLSQESG